MSNVEKRHMRLVEVAQSVSEILASEGFDGEFVASIRMQIEHKAGSLLPPVNGALGAALSNAIAKVS